MTLSELRTKSDLEATKNLRSTLRETQEMFGLLGLELSGIGTRREALLHGNGLGMILTRFETVPSLEAILRVAQWATRTETLALTFYRAAVGR